MCFISGETLGSLSPDALPIELTGAERLLSRVDVAARLCELEGLVTS